MEGKAKDSHKYEHIAGAGCSLPGGYNGHRITTKELQGCKTIQNLMPKDANWKPEADDLDFELHSRFYLSGLSHHAGGRWDVGNRCLPARHGTQVALSDNRPEYFRTPVSTWRSISREHRQDSLGI